MQNPRGFLRKVAKTKHRSKKSYTLQNQQVTVLKSVWISVAERARLKISTSSRMPLNLVPIKLLVRVRPEVVVEQELVRCFRFDATKTCRSNRL
jgi:hypothetical protein